MSFRSKVMDATKTFVAPRTDGKTHIAGDLAKAALKGPAHAAHWLASGHSARTPSPTAAPRYGALPGQFGKRDRLAGWSERLHRNADARADQSRGVSFRGEGGKALANALHFVATAHSANHVAQPEPATPFQSDSLHFVGVDPGKVRDR
jgi:hypothetical protein